MSLFRCQKCNNIENTALTAGYWAKKIKLCSECDHGKWHGRFPKQKFDPKKHKIVNGFVEYK